ncbi:cell division control 14, SIN component [Cryphonectria parasitica EP155]|uniref:Cell division control 14, SIN component n=1 Tax=Cryphonectria parasitica (strain ATCC 38755 / EP155) TaxID=660469 RepID=A0A9P4XTT0_CRYP1|nr:cell division control 14, SIN component [Cryphonectria parasitica EP155]KAF3761107.1 cell division control 14, SIN component [Cryphonectria parasitica EP155]
MEHLLSVSFDHLASFDGPKIKKGLRQIDGLLAQVCLSAHDAAAKKRKVSTNGSHSPNEHQSRSRYSLSDLSGDAAFREFFKLQDGFQWNIATRLVQTLDKLYAKSDDGSLDMLIVSALDSLQGVLLLHPPSRVLFSRVQNMNLLLDLLEPINCPAIQSATLLVLVVALLETPANTRTFEQLDGLLTVSSIFKSRSTARDVKFKTMEFLYFYLMPETPKAVADNGNNNMQQRSPPGRLGKGFASRKKNADGEDVADEGETLSTEKKQRMLGEHLSNVDDLVRDLQQYTSPSSAR